MAAAMVLVIRAEVRARARSALLALARIRAGGPRRCSSGRRDTDPNWPRVLVLLAYTIAVLWFTRIDGDTDNRHVLELAIALGVGILVVPALAARWWLREPLDYSWLRGRWSLKMWLWFPAGFVIAYSSLWVYFNVLTPALHHSWPLPPAGAPGQQEALWRLFWGCNFVGIWDDWPS